MNQFRVFLALLVILIQNLVFWQAVLPEKMQQHQVCVEILKALDPLTLKNHDLHPHHTELNSPIKTDKKMDCHFCQFFHHIALLSTESPTPIEVRLFVKLIALAIPAYLFFYLQRLFLTPQGRGPPFIPIFA